jgi:hypothetical protein
MFLNNELHRFNRRERRPGARKRRQLDDACVAILIPQAGVPRRHRSAGAAETDREGWNSAVDRGVQGPSDQAKIFVKGAPAMKRLIFARMIVLLLGAAAVTSRAEPGEKDNNAQTGPRAEKAKAVAEAWFQALTGADVKKAMALSATPFAWDRKQIVEKTTDLQKLYRSVAQKKGARTLKPDSVTVADDKAEIADRCFPVDRIVVLIKIEDEGIAVCVRPGDEYKVVGFSD